MGVSMQSEFVSESIWMVKEVAEHLRDGINREFYGANAAVVRGKTTVPPYDDCGYKVTVTLDMGSGGDGYEELLRIQSYVKGFQNHFPLSEED